MIKVFENFRNKAIIGSLKNRVSNVFNNNHGWSIWASLLIAAIIVVAVISSNTTLTNFVTSMVSTVTTFFTTKIASIFK